MVEIKPDQKFDKPMPVGDIEVPVSPRAEWRQMFMDTYRFQRDFFYDPNLHGVDWDGLRDRYGTLLTTP
jgi:tricorn protease